ncbi:recombinase family protein [Chitinophaga sedimenti]|uniref:recombinase family protein n=1 Tax=Chitinophaga sedimenti TaxID=2033606 RepID=UPI002003F393|nr:recombinase family protein [Chitinophaga sedimenti]MCK7556568.1 recombinase family protein [Chitinophaga sedimenti]
MYTCNAVVYIVGAPDSQADNKRFSLVRAWKRRYDIRQYCKKRGLTAVRYFADQCRGATMGRPGFSRLLGFVQESTVNIDIILVYSWQDLFSSASELTQIYAEMDRLNIYPEAVKKHALVAWVKHKQAMFDNVQQLSAKVGNAVCGSGYIEKK